jgi:hypothetical protein
VNAPTIRSSTGKNQAVSAKPPTKVGSVLTRKQFVTSRLADFADPKKLAVQIGHGPSWWPDVILKELVDNALDAAEGAGVAPKISITITGASISVSDNGGGMPTKAVKQILNYATKASTNAAYISPTRGQQGNALQTLFAMGHALTGKPGLTVIESRGVRHSITFAVDPISREPRLDLQTKAIDDAGGTKVKIFPPVSPADQATLSDASFNFAWVNPHLTLSFTAPGGLSFEHKATEPGWAKWKPTDPTSAHWYDRESLKTLIAAEIDKANRDRSPQRPVRDFIADFRGLASTVKRSQICEAINASRASLDAFYKRGDDPVRRLLAHMQVASKAVKARDLGILGERHVFAAVGGGASSRYKRVEVVVDGVPYLIEAGFGHRPALSSRIMVTGLNWSTSFGGDPFRYLADLDEGLGSLLSELHAGPEEPIAIFLHVASPRLLFHDHGKSAVDLPDEVGAKIVAAIKEVTQAWTKQRKAEMRNRSAELRRNDAMNASTKPMTIKDAAYAVMAKAYAAASDDGALLANARQIYYAARPDIFKLAGVDTLDSGRLELASRI